MRESVVSLNTGWTIKTGPNSRFRTSDRPPPKDKSDNFPAEKKELHPIVEETSGANSAAVRTTARHSGTQETHNSSSNLPRIHSTHTHTDLLHDPLVRRHVGRVCWALLLPQPPFRRDHAHGDAAQSGPPGDHRFRPPGQSLREGACGSPVESG